MKRFLSLLLASLLLLALTACAGAGSADKMDEILETLERIRETVDAIPPSAFWPEETASDDHAVTFLAENSDFRRLTKKGTLTVGLVGDGESFDPSVGTFAGMYLVYDPLFTVDPNGEIRGVLAEEWEFQDETHLYIKIHDATFSNGDPVTAEDCLWSLRRFAESGSRWSHLFGFLDFENCRTVSSTEFVLAMKEEFGPGIRYLATVFSSVLDKEYVSSAGESAFFDQPVGSGPYTYTVGEDDGAGTFALREDYWNAGDLPEAGTIQIRSYSDSASMLADYENGDLDMAFSLDAPDAERLLSGDITDTNYVIQPGRDVISLVLPEYVEAFEDVRVRRAVAMAVNWESVREIGLGELAGEADSVIPVGVLYKESFGTYEYDPDAAMILLEEAGYDFGQSFEFVVDNSDASVRIAKAIQHDLLAVGINVHLGVCVRTEAEARCNDGETDFMLGSLGSPALDPDQVFGSAASWSDCAAARIGEEPLPTYLEIGRWSVDDAIRAESYRNAQAWMYESLRQIAFAEPYGCYCYRPYIDPGFWCESVSMPNLRYVNFA